MSVGVETLAGYLLGPLGGLAYALWNSHKSEQRGEKARSEWKSAMDAQVTMVKEMADAHKSTAEAVKKELDSCHDNYHRLLEKNEVLTEKVGFLTAKVEALEKRTA